MLQSKQIYLTHLYYEGIAMKKRLLPFILLLLCLIIPFSSVSVSAATKSCTVTLAKKKKTKKIKGLYVGDKLKIKAKNGKKTAKASSLKYKSSKKSVATVSKKGVVTIKKAGTVTITISTKNKKKKAAIKITAKKRSVSVAKGKEVRDSESSSNDEYSYYNLSTSSVSLKEGTSKSISLLRFPGRTRVSGASWSSSQPSVATISNCVIHGIKEGTAIITAQYNGFRYSCYVDVESSFDEGDAIANLRYTTYDSGKGVALVIKNNYKFDLRLTGTLVYKNAYGSMIQSRTDSLYCFESGKTSVLYFSAPNDSNYDDVPYSDFDITFHAEKSSAESIGVDNISISSDRGSDNITAQIRNESGETAAYIRIYCLFFNENGVLIDEEYHFAKCTNPYSTDYITFSYPHDSNYDTVVPSSYKIYTVEAYRYSWT